MPRDFSPYPGKWILIQVMKEQIEVNGGEMPLEDLLNYLGKQGYFKEALRRGLKNLGVEVIGGEVRLR